MKTEAHESNPELGMMLERLTAEISAKLDTERPERGPSNHSERNWCSEIHHPCNKFLTHCRVDWPKRQIIDINGRWRVEEGIDKEWAVKKWLGNVGFALKESERYFSTDDVGFEKYKDLHLSGKIDGLLPLKDMALPSPFDKFRELPAEIKSIAPHFWDSIRTVQDLKRHPKFWINKIPSQLNTYLIFRDWPAGVLILATFGKKLRILPMLFDLELWEADRKKVRSVNAHVKAKTYPPPMPFDPTVCGMCDFDHICKPLKASTTLTQIDGIDEMELEVYIDLKEQNKQFLDMKERLIGSEKKPGKYHGKDALAGDIEIKTIRYPKKVFEIPDDIKQKYRGEDDEVVKTTIERVTK